MSQAITRDLEPPFSGVLPEFPGIEEFSPFCILGCVEAVCRYLFRVVTLSDCYCDHTFVYQHERPGARRKDGGLELDLTFSPNLEQLRARIFERLRELHGIEVVRRDLGSAAEFDQYLDTELAAGRPFASYFDFFYLTARREYGSVHVPHFFCVIGRDPAHGGIHAYDQHQGRIFVPDKDVRDMAEYSSSRGLLHVLECRSAAVALPDTELRRERLRSDLQSFLDNLGSDDRRFGLRALDAFREDVRALIETERSAPRTFYIPGMWNFSFQRRHLPTSLRRIASLCPGLDLSPHEELMDVLAVLHRQWFDLNHRAEAAIAVNRPSTLYSALATLDAISEKERRIPELIENLQRRL